ncbi:hypothetical protein JCM37172_22690 [Faecalimonas hominis]|jgi:hypothetical protein
MSKKVIRNCMLIMAVCFLILGILFKSNAERQKGIQATTGIMIDGKYQPTSSGRIGANQEKYEAANTTGTTFYVLAGVTGVIGVVMLIGGRKK